MKKELLKIMLVIAVATQLIILTAVNAHAQINRYWSTSLNEESSMLAGAVVGGGAGTGAIYYNPAWISEGTMSKFSLNANLISWQFFTLRDAIGDDMDLHEIRFNIKPRFFSYLIVPKNREDLSLQVAIMNKAREEIEFSYSNSIQQDILLHTPGTERYFSNLKFRTRYNEDWVGIGGSHTYKSGLYSGEACLE